jgi:endonuclease/exonuclease/phosphatase family metal-dependent hydrolase
MTRILSYNILVGGTRRVDQLSTVIRSIQPDVVGLAEATDPKVVEELAARLDMQFRLSGRGKGARDWQLAVLSRLPILSTTIHTRTTFTRKHLLEVCVEEPGGSPLTVFVIHQTASFHRGRLSNRIRRAEVQEMLSIMEACKGTPHLVMGDFNSIAPGDDLHATALLRTALREYDVRQKRAAARYANAGTLTKFRRNLLRTTVSTMVNNQVGSFFINKMSPAYARGGIDLLLQAGYVDCFRQMHPRERGFTCPAVAPAGRIDFIFASPELAARLFSSDVVAEVPGIPAHEASDHLAVCADFKASSL